MKIDYTRYYRKFHSETPEHQVYAAALYRSLLQDVLPADHAAPILDVGCGMGHALLTLRDLGYTQISGVDSDEGQIAGCQSNGLAAVVSADTVGFLNSKAGQFQTLLVLDVIEHIPVNQQMGFVEALAAALRSGGTLICTVPNASSLIAARWRYNDWTHHCSFTEDSLDFLLYHGGFQDIRVTAAEVVQRPAFIWLPVGGARQWWAFRFFRFWRRLQMMAELGPAQGRGVPLSPNLRAVARKP